MLGSEVTARAQTAPSIGEQIAKNYGLLAPILAMQ
jgi:hypothetical protein